MCRFVTRIAATDVCATLPPDFRPPPPHKGSKYKVRPYFFAVNISFHVLDIPRFKKDGVGELWGGRAGGCF